MENFPIPPVVGGAITLSNVVIEIWKQGLKPFNIPAAWFSLLVKLGAIIVGMLVFVITDTVSPEFQSFIPSAPLWLRALIGGALLTVASDLIRPLFLIEKYVSEYLAKVKQGGFNQPQATTATVSAQITTESQPQPQAAASLIPQDGAQG